MTSISLTRRAPVLTAVAGRRIARHAWSNVHELAQVLHEANSVLDAAHDEARSVLQQAYEEGYAAGRSAAHAKAVEHLLEAQRTAREFITASEQRVISLAIAIVLRIAPKLDSGDLVAALVHEALSTLHLERHLRICVAPHAYQATQAMLEQWHRAHPEVETVTLESREELDPLTCFVESELGHIEASLPLQLAAIRDALMTETSGSPE